MSTQPLCFTGARRGRLHTSVPFVGLLEWLHPGHLETHTESKPFLHGHLWQLGGPPRHRHGRAAILSWRFFLAVLSCGLSKHIVCPLRSIAPSDGPGVHGPWAVGAGPTLAGYLSRREGRPFTPWFSLVVSKFFACIRPELWEAPGRGSWEFAVNSNLASRVAHTFRAYIPLF